MIYCDVITFRVVTTFSGDILVSRLRVVPHFSSRIEERAKRERAFSCRLFLRGEIFTRARVSLALLSLSKNEGLLIV